MVLIKNGYIKPMAGKDIENGCILIDDKGKIAQVGADLTAPDGAVAVNIPMWNNSDSNEIYILKSHLQKRHLRWL